MRKLKVLPPMRCDDGCGMCCGFVPATETEYRRIERYIAEHGIVPVDQGDTCPLYIDGRCSVYPVRPTICRVFGHAENLPCALGYNVNVPQREADRMIHANGTPTRLLHELVGFSEKMIAWKAREVVGAGGEGADGKSAPVRRPLLVRIDAPQVPRRIDADDV